MLVRALTRKRLGPVPKAVEHAYGESDGAMPYWAPAALRCEATFLMQTGFV